MGLIKKILFLFIAAASAVLITQPAFAGTSSLPWLDFGNNLVWDSNSKTLSNDGTTQVMQVTYADGSSATPMSPFSSMDPVLGVFSYTPPTTFDYYNVFVDFSISFDSDSTNDYLRLWSSDGSNIDWLFAQLDVTGPAMNPLSKSGPYTFGMGTSAPVVASDMGSQWANEFSAALNSSGTGQLSIVSSGSYMERGSNTGVYTVNAFSKVSVAVVPEPMSYVLFIAGASALATRRYWFRRKTS